MDKPGFDAVIPATVRYDGGLRPAAKLLYGEIRALASKEGYCFAGNAYFAEVFSLSTKTISEMVGELCKRQHIYVEVVRDAKNVVQERRIWVSQSLYLEHKEGVGEVLDPPPKNVGTSPDISGYPPPKKPAPYIRSNNTRVNIPPKSPKEMMDELNIPGKVQAVMLAWLAYKAERHEDYKPTGLATLLGRAASNAREYGEKAVVDVVENCMGNNYQGITWDKLGFGQKKPAPAQRKEPEGWY